MSRISRSFPKVHTQTCDNCKVLHSGTVSNKILHQHRWDRVVVLLTCVKCEVRLEFLVRKFLRKFRVNLNSILPSETVLAMRFGKFFEKCCTNCILNEHLFGNVQLAISLCEASFFLIRIEFNRLVQPGACLFCGFSQYAIGFVCLLLVLHL